MCPKDPKGICNITTNVNMSRLDAKLANNISIIPANYFCSFNFSIENSESALIDIWRRAFSIRKPKELIDVKMVQYKPGDEEEEYSTSITKKVDESDHNLKTTIAIDEDGSTENHQF